jgi:uncharacterized protein YndB with AHSA1/START domain
MVEQNAAAAVEDGVLIESGGKYELRFRRRYDHPIGRVWAALTEPELLTGWLAEAEIDLREGGTVVLRWQNAEQAEEVMRREGIDPDREDTASVLHGTITELDPPRLLEWEGDIHGTLRWELEPDGDATVLTFTSTMEELEQRFKSMNLAGWHVHLDILERALGGEPFDWATDWDRWGMPRWEQHHARYLAAVGGGERGDSRRS